MRMDGSSSEDLVDNQLLNLFMSFKFLHFSISVLETFLDVTSKSSYKSREIGSKKYDLSKV